MGESLQRRFLTNISTQLISLILSKLAVFAPVVIGVRILGVEGFGRYAFVVSFLSLFIIVSDLGIVTLGAREIAKDRNQVGKYFSVKLLLTFAFSSLAAFALLFAFYIASDAHLNMVTVVGIGSGFLVLQSISSSFAMVLMGVNRLDYVAVAENGGAVILSFMQVLSLYLYPNVLILTALYVLSMIPKIWILYSFVKHKYNLNLKLELSGSLPILKAALPIMVIAVFYRLYFSIDTSLLWFLKGDEAVGKYTPSFRILDLAQAFPVTFMAALFPVISRLSGERAKVEFIFEKTQKYFFALSSPIAIGGFVLAEYATGFLYGTSGVDREIIVTFKILMWTIIFLYGDQFLGNFLISINQEKLLPKVVITCTVLNVAGNIVLIPIYGIVGAAAMTLFCEVLQFVTLFSFSVIKLRFRITEKWKFGGILVSSALMGLLLFVVQGRLSITIMVPIAIVVYLSGLFVFRVFDKTDLMILKAISPIRG